MCKHGTEIIVRVKIPANLSHTGEARWKDVGIDSCIAQIVTALQKSGVDMSASCCGHGKGDGRIDLLDERVLVIKNKGIGRSVPRNLQTEPPYPDIDGMVMLSMSDPEWTGHLKHLECEIEEPHKTDVCGLWKSDDNAKP